MHKLPPNTILFLFPYPIILSAALCFALIYFLPAAKERLSLRSFSILAGVKCLALLAFTLMRPAPILEWSNETVLRRFGYEGLLVVDAARSAVLRGPHDLLKERRRDVAVNPYPRLHTAVRTSHVVVIQVESLDSMLLADRVGDEVVMPTLDALAKVVPPIPVETHHLAVSGSIGTDFQFLTGFRQPGQRNAFLFDLSPLAPDSLPGFCRQEGISFQYFHGNIPSFWRRSDGLRELGVNSWCSSLDVTHTEPARLGASDRDMVTAMLAAVAKDPEKNQLYYWITFSNHVPFDFISNNRFKGDSRAIRVANVFNHTDAQIRRVIEQWPFEDTVFVMFGDHQAPIPGHHAATVPTFLFTRRHGLLQPMPFLGRVPREIELPTLHDFVEEVLTPSARRVGR